MSSGGIREKYKGQEGEDVRNAKVAELVSLDQSAEQLHLGRSHYFGNLSCSEKNQCNFF